MITIQELEAVKDEVKRHFDYVWPLVVEGRENPDAIDRANAYLGEVKVASLPHSLEYHVVIRMIERACGLSWDAIVGTPSRLIVARA